MSEEKSLPTRVAEALGLVISPICWSIQRVTEFGPVYFRRAECRHGDSCRPDTPPYGADSSEGWACTGPLQERFMLEVTYTNYNNEGWIAFQHGGVSGTGVITHNPCSAIAEWVAQRVENGRVKNG